MKTIHLDFDNSVKYYHLVISDLVRTYVESGKVLDIGSGGGHIIKLIKEKSPFLEIYAADIESYAFDKVQNVITDSFMLTEDRFDLSHIDIQFDCCIMSHVLEHLDRPKEVIQKVLNVLRPGGILILAVPNPVTPVNFLKCGLRRYQANAGHVMTWDRGHWLTFLKNIHGAEILSTTNDEVFLFPRKTPVKSIRKRFEIGMSKVFPGWTFSSISVLAKI